METLSHKSEPALVSYIVNFINTPFTTPAGITYPKTARVDFFDRREKKIDTIEYAYRERGEVFSLIETKSIDLDYCYVNNFSLADYRKIKSLPDNQVIQFFEFSAHHSFFDCLSVIDFSFAEFSGVDVDFESAIFGSGQHNFMNTDFGNAHVNFTRSRFGEGITDFRFAKFGQGNVTFNYSNFGKGDVSFVNTSFGSGKLSFESVHFGGGDIDFKYAKFSNGDVSFEKAVFGNGRKDFKAVEFGDGKIDFKRVHFNDGDVSFEGLELKEGRISFRMSVFGKGNIDFELADLGKKHVLFEKVEFNSGKVSFHKASVEYISFKGSQMNAYFNFKFSHCGYLDLNDTIIRDVVELRTGGDSQVNIRTLSILGIIRLGRIIMDWKGNNVKSLIYSQDKSSYRNKADQFRLLKEEFHNSGKYNDEDKAYVEFKRCEQKAELESLLMENKLNAVWAYPLNGFKWLVFDRMGQYATNPFRVIVSMAVIYSIFSLLCFGLPFIMPTEIHSSFHLGDAHSLATSFYYSAITFFTIGYGDYYPTGFLRVIATMEGFSGMFLMAYFTVAFVRKILR